MTSFEQMKQELISKLMGNAMKELRGKADGKKIHDSLEKYVDELLSEDLDVCCKKCEKVLYTIRLKEAIIVHEGCNPKP